MTIVCQKSLANGDRTIEYQYDGNNAQYQNQAHRPQLSLRELVIVFLAASVVDTEAWNKADRNQQNFLPTSQEHAGKHEQRRKQTDRVLTPFLTFGTQLHLVETNKQVGEQNCGSTERVGKFISLFRKQQREQEDRL